MAYNKQYTKVVLYPILYWIILIIFPFFIAYSLKDYNGGLNIPGVIMFYIMFIAPFLFFFPYRLARVTPKQKLFFVLIGLVVPYIILYIYTASQVMSAFNSSRFPF